MHSILRRKLAPHRAHAHLRSIYHVLTAPIINCVQHFAYCSAVFLSRRKELYQSISSPMLHDLTAFHHECLASCKTAHTICGLCTFSIRCIFSPSTKRGTAKAPYSVAPTSSCTRKFKFPFKKRATDYLCKFRVVKGVDTQSPSTGFQISINSAGTCYLPMCSSQCLLTVCLGRNHHYKTPFGGP